MEEAGPMPERAGWTGTQIGVLVILLIVTNAVTGVVVFLAVPQPTGPAALTVIHPWAGAERDLFKPVLNAFTDDTGIIVQDRTFRQEDLQTSLPIQFTAGTTPADVIFMASGFIRQWGVEGWAMDITSRIDTADYLPGFVDPVTDGTTIYGAPFTYKPKPGFWYRDSNFSENPTWDRTPADLTEFIGLLNDIQTDAGIVPIVNGADPDAWPLSDVTEHVIATFGGSQMHRDLTTGAAKFTDTAVRDLLNDSLLPLLPFFDQPVAFDAGMADLWANNNALYFQGSFMLAFAQIKDPSDMRFIPLPVPASVTDPGHVLGADYLFVPTFTSRSAEALQLLDFLTGKDGQEAQIAGAGHFATFIDVDPTKYNACCDPADFGDKEALADLDDTVGGTFQKTFWRELALLWAVPTEAQLDSSLALIEADRPA